MSSEELEGHGLLNDKVGVKCASLDGLVAAALCNVVHVIHNANRSAHGRVPGKKSTGEICVRAEWSCITTKMLCSR